ncbi:TPA: helix-turn-helix domain-containing protein [Enterococcus faecalis]
MIDFFLKKQTIKLDILLELSNQKKIDFLSYFIKKNIPRTTLKRIFDNLNNDLKENELPCRIEQDEQKRYYLTFSEKTSALTTYQRLKLIYLKESLHFQLLSILLTTPTSSIYLLSEKLMVSTSYCYRLIRELNIELQTFRLTIETKKKGEQIKIIGHEQTFRIFSFIILSEAYQTIEWPFQHITKQNIIESISLSKLKNIHSFSPSKQNQVFFLIAITDLRIKNKCRLKKMNPDLLDFVKILKENVNFADDTLILNQRYYLDDKTLNNEVLFYNALFRILIAHTILPEQKQVAGKKLCLSNTTLSNSIIELAKAISDEFGLNSELNYYYELIYFLAIYELLLSLINVSIDSFSQASDRYADSTEKLVYNNKLDIQIFYKKFLKNNINLKLSLVKDSNFVYTCNFINTLVRIYSCSSLSIYFQFSKNFLGERLISQKISNMFNSSTLKFTKNFYQANLVISDSMDTIKELDGKNYFYFNNIDDKKLWVELIMFIQFHVLESANKEYGLIWKEYLS